MKVLIIGGYGFFGGKLSELLAHEAGLHILIAGRSLQKAQAACDKFADARAQFSPLRLDRNKDIAVQLKGQDLDLIIDVSGPFQTYGKRPYAVIDYALETSIHYLDIADGAEFVEGVSKFDSAAKDKKLTVLTGVSTYPVLSSCAVDHLASSLDSITHIRAGIAPSPHNDMGRSVVDAISSYAGKAFPVLKNGKPDQAYGLTEGMTRRICAPGKLPLDPLLFSNVDVPDSRLFGEYYNGLQSIWNGAGPKPVILHRFLMGLAKLVKWRVLPSLLPLSPVFHFCMKHIASGAHRGGMFVEVDGLKDNKAVTKSWHLVGEGDDGPFIPVIPLAVLVKKMAKGDFPKHGARAAMGDLSLADYEAEFSKFNIFTGVFDETAKLSLYEETLGSVYKDMSEPLQNLHRIGKGKSFEGRCKVTRGRNPLSHIVASVLRMPKSASDIPVKVVLTRDGNKEIWERFFDGRRMVSTQEAGHGKQSRLVIERFGPIAIHLAVLVEDGRQVLKTVGWSFLGIPLPKMLVPGGDVFEHDADGRFNFHVDLVAPIFGRLVKYEGWLEPLSEPSAFKAE